MSFVKKIIKKLTTPSILYFYWLRLRYRNTQPRVNKTLRTPDGVFSVADIQSFTWQYKEIFVDKIYNFKTSSPNPVIVDCGSNIGLSVRYFKTTHKNSTVYAVEPDKEIAGFLKKNTEPFSKTDQVQIINKAAWIADTTLSFHSDGADGGTLVDAQGENKIDCFDFSKWLSQLARIDFLKMDIEGAEYEVLLHAKDQLAKVQNLFVEYHSFKNKTQNLPELLLLLRSLGFRVYMNTIAPRSQPFYLPPTHPKMDLQLNIFATRES